MHFLGCVLARQFHEKICYFVRYKNFQMYRNIWNPEMTSLNLLYAFKIYHIQMVLRLSSELLEQTIAFLNFKSLICYDQFTVTTEMF